jgi:hypothetical protein
MKSISLLSILGLGGLVVVATTHLGCGSDSNTGSGGAGGSTSSGGGTNNTGGSPGTGGTATGGSSSGGGGAGGGGQTGPFPGTPGKWTFQSIDGSECMDGSATGIGTNTASTADSVFIYMEGGNACFNGLSCAKTANLNGYVAANLATDAATLDAMPIFDRTSSLFKDYNYVFIPYCTGDVHAGDNDTMVAGTMRHFHGAHNMDLYLARIKSAFPHAKKIIISGSSAGGFGAAFNYDRAAKAFPNVKVALIDDSGPPMGEAFVPSCLQKLFKDTWGLDKTLPAACTDCKNNDAFMEPLVTYISSTYSDRRLSLISSSQDGTISVFWGFGYDGNSQSPTYGQPNCATAQTIPYSYPGAEYAMGLQDLRDRIIGATQPNFKMFIIDSTQADGNGDTHHVWLDQDPTMLVENSVTYETFLEQQLSGDAAWSNEGLP